LLRLGLAVQLLTVAALGFVGYMLLLAWFDLEPTRVVMYEFDGVDDADS